MNKGVFCISIDTELLWGRHDLHYQPFIQRSSKERQIISSLLSLFKKYSIPATWAIVGHLFLDSCTPFNETKHGEIIRPIYPWVKGDWFNEDPCSTLSKEPYWYGKDIVEEIRKTEGQEIGCHSFSHIIFGHPGCSKEAAQTDVENCINLAKRSGVNLRSFVFPRNLVGHLDVLKRSGFKSFRGPDRSIQKTGFIYLDKVIQLLDLLLIVPHANKITIELGLVNIPESMYFLSLRGPRKYIPIFLRVLKAKRGIKKAIQEGGVFHLWFHPVDLAENPKELIKALEKIIVCAKSEQAKGNLDIKSMEQIAAEFKVS
jgi:peptidoglycan/xylan/chitin deacetylase (PgdA/CDA1 family)